MSEEKMSVVFKIVNENNDPDIVKIGTRTECQAYMCNILFPSDSKRNIHQKDSEFSARISMEELEKGNWIHAEYFLQTVYEN